MLPVAAAFDSEDEDEPVYSGHESTLVEVRSRFVDAHPESLTRPALWLQLEWLIDQAEAILPCFLVLVSGEFATNVTDPQVLFVVLDVPGEDLEMLQGNDRLLVDALFNNYGGREFGTTTTLTIRTGIVRAYPPQHGKFDLGNDERRVQRLLASDPVETDEDWGYVEILICAEGLEKVHEIFAPPSA